MSSNADVIAEARRLHAYPFVRIGEVSVPISVPTFAAQANDLLPQLADALEAAEAEIGRLNRDIAFNDEAYLAEHVTWGNCQWKARLAKMEDAARAVFKEFDHPNWPGNTSVVEAVRELMTLTPARPMEPGT